MKWKDKERLLQEIHAMWDIFAHTVHPEQVEKLGQYLDAKARAHAILAENVSPEKLDERVRVKVPEGILNGGFRVGEAWLGIDGNNGTIMIFFIDGQLLVVWEGELTRVKVPEPETTPKKPFPAHQGHGTA